LIKPNALLSTFYTIIATYVEFFIGLVISVLVARQLGPEQYGVYGYMMWVSTLLVTLINGGVSLGVIKFIAEARAGQVNESRLESSVGDVINLHNYLQFLQFKKSIFFVVVSCGLVYFVSEMQLAVVNPSMLVIIIIAAMIKSYHMYYVAVLKGFEDFRSLAILSGLITPFNLLLILICFYTKQTLMVYVWVYLAVSAMYLTISYFLSKKNIGKDNAKNKIKRSPAYQQAHNKFKTNVFRHVRTASWIAILNFIVLRQSELFFLNIFSTTDVMAYFNVGYTLASAAITLVPGVYSTILLPLMARMNQEADLQVEKQLNLSLRYMLQLIIALLFPVCFFAKEIFTFLYGTQYLNAVLPFQVIIGCIASKTLSDCINAYLWSKNKQSFMLKLIVVGSIVTLVLDFYFIKLYQLQGALLAFSLSTLFFVGLNIVLVMRKLRSHLEWMTYVKTILSGAVAIIIISPVDYYLPNIAGIVVGSFGYIVLYIMMLLVTFSLSIEDIAGLRKLNQRFFRYSLFERFLVAIQISSAYKHKT
jgi:O-antigen/teichoic acid export membrane protein